MDVTQGAAVRPVQRDRVDFFAQLLHRNVAPYDWLSHVRLPYP